MKKTLLRLICLSLAVFMMFSMAGCGNKNTSSFSEDMGDFDLDFGNSETASTDDAQQDGKDATASDADTTKDNASDNASNGSNATDKGNNNGGSNANNSSTNNGTNANVSQSTADLDKLSWNQLLAQMPKSLKGTVITVASWNPAKEVTGAEKVIANFEKLTGIKVNWKQVSYNDYDSQIAALVNSNSSPDLIRYYSPAIHRMYLCQDVKTATGYDFKGEIWDKRVTSQYTIKGKIYGVNLKDTYVQQPKVFMYRKSVIESAQLDDPYVLWKKGKWDWNTFIQMCKDYKEINPSGYAWMTYNAVDYMDLTGVTMIKFDGNKFTNNIKDVNVYKALKQMCDYRAADIIPPAFRDQKVFSQGNTLFMTFNSIANRRTNANLTEVKNDQDLYCVPVPTIKGRENVQAFSELEAYGIPKGAKNAAAVYYFLRYYLDASNYDANEFFVNKQAYEVYKECMSKKEFYIATATELLDVVAEDAGGNVAGLTGWIANGGAAAQLEKELDSVKPTFELATKKANEALSKFK